MNRFYWGWLFLLIFLFQCAPKLTYLAVILEDNEKPSEYRIKVLTPTGPIEQTIVPQVLPENNQWTFRILNNPFNMRLPEDVVEVAREESEYQGKIVLGKNYTRNKFDFLKIMVSFDKYNVLISDTFSAIPSMFYADKALERNRFTNKLKQNSLEIYIFKNKQGIRQSICAFVRDFPTVEGTRRQVVLQSVWGPFLNSDNDMFFCIVTVICPERRFFHEGEDGLVLGIIESIHFPDATPYSFAE